MESPVITKVSTVRKVMCEKWRERRFLKILNYYKNRDIIERERERERDRERGDRERETERERQRETERRTCVYSERVEVLHVTHGNTVVRETERDRETYLCVLREGRGSPCYTQ